MKEHILRECINALRDIAVKYHDHDCLREVIKTRLLQAFHDDAEWYRQYEAVSHVNQHSGPTMPDMTLKLPNSKDYMVKL